MHVVCVFFVGVVLGYVYDVQILYMCCVWIVYAVVFLLSDLVACIGNLDVVFGSVDR